MNRLRAAYDWAYIIVLGSLGLAILAPLLLLDPTPKSDDEHEAMLAGFGVIAVGIAGILLASLLLSGCAAHCAQPLQIDLARHPAGKPKPAALVLARCGDQRWQWICDEVTATADAGVVCDGVVKVRVLP